MSMNGDENEHDGIVTCKRCKYFYWYLPETDESRYAECIRVLYAPKAVSPNTPACDNFAPGKYSALSNSEGDDANVHLV